MKGMSGMGRKDYVVVEWIGHGTRTGGSTLGLAAGYIGGRASGGGKIRGGGERRGYCTRLHAKLGTGARDTVMVEDVRYRWAEHFKAYGAILAVVLDVGELGINAKGWIDGEGVEETTRG